VKSLFTDKEAKEAKEAKETKERQSNNKKRF
jgi:hypothetical protein